MSKSDEVLSRIGKKKTTTKSVILGVVIATIVAIVAGGGIGMQFSSLAPHDNKKSIPKKIESKVQEKTITKVYIGNRMVKVLLPIVTNLAEPKNSWVRLEGAIVFDSKDPVNFDVLTAQVSEDTLAYLRTLRMTDLEGASALAYVHDDLTERARIRSKGKILEFIISSLVVE